MLLLLSFFFLNIHVFHLSETHWQYSVIARPINTHRIQVKQISREIAATMAYHLGAYITTSDISYRAPNFIIHLNNAHLQRQAVSSPILRATSFSFQMVPWSREHDLAQLPWITGLIIEWYNVLLSNFSQSILYIPLTLVYNCHTERPPKCLQINIDPLKILPLLSQIQTHAGNKCLHHLFFLSTYLAPQIKYDANNSCRQPNPKG